MLLSLWQDECCRGLFRPNIIFLTRSRVSPDKRYKRIGSSIGSLGLSVAKCKGSPLQFDRGLFMGGKRHAFLGRMEELSLQYIHALAPAFQVIYSKCRIFLHSAQIRTHLGSFVPSPYTRFASASASNIAPLFGHGKGAADGFVCMSRV